MHENVYWNARRPAGSRPNTTRQAGPSPRVQNTPLTERSKDFNLNRRMRTLHAQAVYRAQLFIVLSARLRSDPNVSKHVACQCGAFLPHQQLLNLITLSIHFLRQRQTRNRFDTTWNMKGIKRTGSVRKRRHRRLLSPQCPLDNIRNDSTDQHH